MAMTALPIQPPPVFVSLYTQKQTATWLLYRVLYSLMAAVVSAISLTLAPQCQAFHYSSSNLGERERAPSCGLNGRAVTIDI